MKKIVSMLMLLVMLLALLAGAMAEQSQITYQGGTTWYDKNGHQLNVSGAFTSNANAWVELSKTIEATGIENEFIVTMNVKTKQEVKTLSSTTPNAATVLVIDVSNSMNKCEECGQDLGGERHTGKTVKFCPDGSGKYYEKRSNNNSSCKHCGERQNAHTQEGTYVACSLNKSRMEQSKSAAIAFVREFGRSTGAVGDDKRMVAVVVYGSDAWSNNTWYDVATASGLAAAEKHISSITLRNGSTDNNKGGTNIEGGLMLAKNVLNAGLKSGGKINGFEYLYTILMTDGEPTYYVNGDSASTTTITGTRGGGSETTKNDAKDVGTEAAAIRALGGKGLSKLYSICMGEGLWSSTPFGTWNDANPKTTGTTTVGQWLSSFSTSAYDGEAVGLFDSFDAVLYQIQLAAKAWRVEDWMGDHITYLGKVDVKNSSGNGTIFNAANENPNAADYVSHQYGAPDYVWNILGSEASYDSLVQRENGTVSGYIGYTFKYKVRLENQHMAYHNALLANNGSIVVNDLATLKYVVTDEQGNWPTNDSGIHTAEFAQPKVKGLLGELTFDKVDQNGDQIRGDITFRLKADHHEHEGEQSEAAWTYAEATTDANGRVVFKNIPSGHDYTLIEAATDFDDGYNYVDGGDIHVDVDWGVAKSNMSDLDRDGVAELINAMSEYPLATIVLEKAFGAGSEIPSSIKMRITATNDQGEVINTYERTLSANDAINGVWTWAFTDLEPGFKYMVEELNAMDANGNPLKDGYNLTWAVSVDGVQKDAATFVQGNEDTHPKTPEVISIAPGGSATVRFTNTMTKKLGSLTVAKAYSGLPQGTALAPVTITVTAADGGVVRSINLPVDNSWTYTFADLPIGQYTVTESAMGDIGNYKYVYNQFVSGDATRADSISVGVQENAATAVQVTNYYTEKLGTIIVTKDFPEDSDLQGDGAMLANLVIKATLYKPNGETEEIELSQANNWTRILSNMPLGNYAVVEDASGATVDHYDLEVSYDPVATINGVNAAGAPLTEDGQRVILDIYNKYTQQTGTITVRKSFSGDLNANSAQLEGKVFTVAIKKGEQTVETLTLNRDNNWSATSLPLGQGETYTLVETGGEIENHDWTATITIDGESTNSVELQGAVNAAIVNNYVVHKGSALISKTMDGIDAKDMPQKITVILTNTETQADYVAELTASAIPEQNWTALLANLPVGKYTVKEGEDAQVSGYDLKASFKVGNNKLSANEKFEITKDSQITVEIENAYEKHTGFLTVEKKFGAMSQNLQDIAYGKTYTVYVLDEAGKEAAKLSLKGSDWKASVELPLGTYTLLEESNAAQIDGYTLDVNYSGAVEIKRDNQQVSASVTNTYTVKNGTLELIKRNVGNTARMPEQISFSITAAVGDTESGLAYSATETLSAQNDWTVMLSLEPGVYTLTENTDDATTSILWTGAGLGGQTAAGKSVQVIIDHEATATVICTNDYEHFHDLTFYKRDSYDGSAMKNVEFTLTHKDHNAQGSQTCTEPIAQMKATSDKDGKVTFTGIEAGHEYTLEEKPVNGYTTMSPTTVIVSDRGITVTGDLQDYVVYNTRTDWPTQDLQFTKISVQGKRPIAGIEFALKHSSTCPDCSGQPNAELAKTWTAISDANGKVKFEDLPVKHTYTLEETKHTGYLHNGPWTVTVSESKAELSGVSVTGNGTLLDGYEITNEPSEYAVAKISFMKHNSYTHAPLAGAQFTLTHDDANCKYSEWPTGFAKTLTATADANGLVEFVNVPRHHQYILTETVVPAGFAAMEPVILTVGTDENGEELVNGLPTYNGVIYNHLTQWPALSLTFNKLSSVDNSPIAGIGFTLTHDSANCDTCKNTPAGMDKLPANIENWTSGEVFSDSQGKVVIGNIPTMHRYVLTETTSGSYQPLSPIRVRASATSVLMEGVTDNKLYNIPSTWPRRDISFYKYSTYTQNPLSGVVFTLEHHPDCRCAGLPSDVGNKLTATSNAQGLVTFAGVAEGHAYLLSEQAPDGYAQVGPWKVSVYSDAHGDKIEGLPVNAQNILYNNLSNWPAENLTFRKINVQTQEPIAGIEFAIKHSDNCPNCSGLPESIASVMKATSDANGNVVFTGLPVKHTYTLSETKHDGYHHMADKTVRVEVGSVTLDGAPVTENTTISNHPTNYHVTKIAFTKFSSYTGAGLAGAEFTLTHSANCPCAYWPSAEFAVSVTAISKADGTVEFVNIPTHHTYTLSETGVPDGYVGMQKNLTIVVDDDDRGNITISGLPASGVIYNDLKTWPVKDLEFKKYSKLTNGPIAGVEFTITHSANCPDCVGLPEGVTTQSWKATSDAQGEVKFTGLPVNHTYTLEETKHDGYQAIAAMQVTVTENGVTVAGMPADKIVYNVPSNWPKTSLSFYKYSNYTNGPIEGVQFKLTHSDACADCSGIPEEIHTAKEVLSAKDGLVKFDDVPVNHTFVISEVKAPDGYQLMKELTVTVTLSDNSVTITGLENGSTIYNERTDWPKDDITFTKISAIDSHVLPGVMFDLVHVHEAQKENYCCDREIDIAEATTDAYGKVTLKDVPRQHTYVLVETKTPEGYKTMAPKVVSVMEGQPIMIGGQQLSAGFAIKNDPIYWPMQIQLTALKTMDGKTPTDEYTFVLSDANGEIERVNNAAETITFSTYTIAKPGTYVFTISELAGEDLNVIYDSAVYTATVCVTADAEGRMSAEVSYEKDGETHEGDIVFANMTMPKLPQTGDHSSLAPWLALMGMACAAMLLLRRRAQN